MKNKNRKCINNILCVFLLLVISVNINIPSKVYAETLSSGQCGNNVFWSLDSNGTMRISGKGKMWDFRNDSDKLDYHQNPYESYKNKIKNLVIEEGITAIGADAFTECNNLTNVEFPEGLLEIGYFSFRNCCNLTNIKLPNSLKSILQQAFDNTGITSLEIPDSVNFIDSGICENCTKLKKVYIGGDENTGYIYSTCPFRNCTSLEKIEVSENNVAYISVDGVLYSKDKSVLVQYPLGKKDENYDIIEGCSSISYFAIEYPVYLKNITLPTTMINTGQYNFLGICSITNKAEYEILIGNDGIQKWYNTSNNAVTVINAGETVNRRIDYIKDRSVEVYRLYNSSTGEHLYTTDSYEARVLTRRDGWTYEGIGWYAPKSGIPVYRLYNPVLRNHLYTTDMNEVRVLSTKDIWTVDNNGQPLFYSGGDKPIYRLYARELQGMHHLTTDLNEYKTLPKISTWKQEGIALYSNL